MNLPDGIWLQILGYLNSKDLVYASFSCKLLKDLSECDGLWKVQFRERWGKYAENRARKEIDVDLLKKCERPPECFFFS